MKKISAIEILNSIRQYEVETGRSLTNAEKVAIITDTLKKDIKTVDKSKRRKQ
jgi:hypothetical protein